MKILKGYAKHKIEIFDHTFAVDLDANAVRMNFLTKFPYSADITPDQAVERIRENFEYLLAKYIAPILHSSTEEK